MSKRVITVPYRIIKEPDGYAVWKVDDKGEKVERKNKTAYKSRADALPYLRKLYSLESASLETEAEQAVMDFEAEPTPEPQTIVASEAQLVLGAVHFEADADPRFLRFHDAVLARAETNSNRDSIDNDGVTELASTIAGTPIDDEHKPTRNIGFYTDGRNDNGVLKVDGVVWIDRCEALGINPEDIESGAYKLSIEAEAQTARCSICDTTHESIASYCKHLRNKVVYGATRFLSGLRARGGAITRTPAGSETTFSPSSMVFIASHQEQNWEEDMDSELTASELETVETWVNEVVSAIKRREDVSPADKKRAEKEYGDVEYADEKNKKYPLTKDKIHAAWSYINMPKNAAKYSSEELKTIKNKIKRAAKKFGMEIADDDKSKTESSKESNMDDMHEEMKEPAGEEKKEKPEDEKKENETEAAYAKMKSDMDTMMADLEAKKADLANEQTAKATLDAKVKDLEARVQSLEAALQTARTEVTASRVSSLKSQLVGSVLDEAEFETQKDKLLAMDADTVALLIKAATKRESTEVPKKPESRIFASETAPEENGRVKFVL